VVSSVPSAEGTFDTTPAPVALFVEGLVRCPERNSIAEQFAEAVKAYSEVVNGLSTVRGYQFKQHQQLVEQTRIACEGVRKSLRDHEHEHGCTLADPKELAASAHDPG
jgi:hypothetical protein